MGPDQVRRIRKALTLTQLQFAALLGVHLVTVKKWETGAQKMRLSHDRLIRLLAGRLKPVTRHRTTRKPGKRNQTRGGR